MAVDAAKFISLLWVFVVVSVTTSAHRSPHQGRPIDHHDYSRRFAEVTRHCQSLLASAGELSVEADRASLLMGHLYFTDGDWSQDAGHAPLFPSNVCCAGAGKVAGPEFLQAAAALASFSVTQVQAQVQQRRGAFNVSGLLTLTLPCNCSKRVAEFQAPFEGLYTETLSSSGSGGDRVLCMVGNSALPWRSSNLSDLAKNNHGGGGGEIDICEPPLSAGANILLVLRYPKAHTLTTRAVRGEMTSLSDVSDGAYFDTVRLVSRLSPYHSRYQFTTGADMTAGCSSHPSLGHLYRGASFCDILAKFNYYDHVHMAVVPNWNCNSTDEFCSRPGPFDASGRAATMPFTRAAVTVQDLQCYPVCCEDGTAAAKVSLVFRFVAPWEDQAAAPKRTGLSGHTLSAEGAWTASTGKLCMAACLGAGEEACRYRVTLHVSTAFSITRRSIVVGKITATDGCHYPLSFGQRVHPGQLGRSGEAVPVAYHYTKIKQAGELLRGGKPSRFRDNFIVRSLVSYPKIAGAADDLVSLSSLADDLGRLWFQSMLKLPFVPEWIEDPVNIELQILSVGTLVGSYSPPFEDGSRTMPVEKTDRAHGVEKQRVFNVSAEFTATRMYLEPTPVMSLEGVYDQEHGRMYLVGCRNVHAPWRDLANSRDLEDGMDCSIEVTVQYPPTKMRWLINPAATVSVASTREDDDPLHFTTTELRSMPVLYSNQRGALTETALEDLMCIAMLSATIAATFIQLRHVDSHGDVAPYVSLAMVGVQAVGYGGTLVTNAKMLPAWPRQSHKLYTDHLECWVRALTLTALLLTAWLAHKVWRSRAQARARSPLEPGRVPDDRAVLLCSLPVYSAGLFAVLAAHWLRTPATPSSNMWSWGDVVEWYVGVVKEWFLLPQVVGNALWRVNCKPLAGRYYAGVTAAWLLPHAYGYLRPTFVGMYPGDLYSKAAAVVVPGVGAVLALLVFVQQRWNYRIVGWATRTKRNKLPQHVY